MNLRLVGTVRRTSVLAAAALLLSACGGGDPAPAATASTPKGFEVPAGVELTADGTALKIGESANVVYDAGDGATSALTSKVTSVKKGKIEDFRFFSLDSAARASTPYYVSASVTNQGPAGLGGIGAPFVARDDSNTVTPPNAINGEFEPCSGGTLPKSFLAGETAKICMVFLVPKGRSLESIDAQSADTGSAVRWKV